MWVKQYLRVILALALTFLKYSLISGSVGLTTHSKLQEIALKCKGLGLNVYKNL